MVTMIESIRDKVKLETVRENLRRVRHAGIGAAVMLQEEVVDLVDRFVERGEAAETEGSKLVDKLLGGLLGKRKESAKQAVSSIGEELDTRWTKVLNKLNLTTKSDIQGLTRHLEELADKLDKLSKKKPA